jgi:hypothetical protein
MKYAAMLSERMQRHGTHAWLVNTGWTGGRCGAGRAGEGDGLLWSRGWWVCRWQGLEGGTHGCQRRICPALRARLTTADAPLPPPPPGLAARPAATALAAA